MGKEQTSQAQIDEQIKQDMEMMRQAIKQDLVNIGMDEDKAEDVITSMLEDMDQVFGGLGES